MVITKIIKIIERLISVVKLCFYKIIYSKNIVFKCFPRLKKDTKIKIINNGKLDIGLVSFYENVTLALDKGNLSIGSNVCFNRNSIIVCKNSITIKDDCMFGPNVMIYDHDHKYDKNGISLNDYKLGSIVIEKNCWIGAGCIILRNTHIGEGSVIGAGCVVKGIIPPHSLVRPSNIVIVENIR